MLSNRDEISLSSLEKGKPLEETKPLVQNAGGNSAPPSPTMVANEVPSSNTRKPIAEELSSEGCFSCIKSEAPTPQPLQAVSRIPSFPVQTNGMEEAREASLEKDPTSVLIYRFGGFSDKVLKFCASVFS